MLNRLWRNIDPSTTVLITPNKRLAAYLNLEYDEYKIMLQKKAWPTLSILPLEIWLKSIWQIVALQDRPILLNPQQTSVLWRQIIINSNYDEGLIAIDSLTEQAQKAWELMQKWQIPLSSFEIINNDDIVAFQCWAQKFIEICKEKNFLDPSRLAASLINALESGRLTLSQKHIVFVGFDVMPNQMSQLFSTLQSVGCKISQVDPNDKKNTREKMVVCSDRKQEILSMSLWTKAKLAKNPRCSVGCIVMELSSLRDQIERVFQEVFLQEKIFNISLGKNLASFLPILSALQLLKLAAKTDLSLEDVVEILHSPFLASAETEMIGRARYETELRSYKSMNFAWQVLLKQLKPNLVLSKILKRYWQHSSEHVSKLFSPSRWAKIFSYSLQILGWPGERSLNSVEYQLVQRWSELLHEFASLDLVVKKISYKDAWAKLYCLAQNAIFQPKQEKTPINILGVLEAAGMNFDHLWIMGIDDENWPKSPKINPFIPMSLQRKFGLPHASCKSELHLAEMLTARFKRSADEIVYSYTAKIADREIKISPLIVDIPKINIADLQLGNFTPLAVKIYQARKLESISAEKAPPVYPLEKIYGGSKILKLQALCPFRAFAECRLQAEELDVPQFGLDKLERGALIHAALEEVWHRLKNHRQLCALKSEEIQVVIARSLDKAFNAAFIRRIHQSRKPKCKEYITRNSLLNIERRCLMLLLQRWLDLEKSRPYFEVIGLEKKFMVNLAQLNLRLRLDRIDRLENGDLVIIDYKTGKSVQTIADWFSERPEDPQLPLYSITSLESISGLVFAKINIDALAFVGITRNRQQLPEVLCIDDYKIQGQSSSWRELLQNWHKVLEKLAYDFRLGKAEVNPKNPQSTCKFCQLSSLCRMHLA